MCVLAPDFAIMMNVPNVVISAVYKWHISVAFCSETDFTECSMCVSLCQTLQS